MKEFSEASFRIKRSDFDPLVEWKAEQGDPGTHLVMAVFGCQVYALNKCAESFSESNVKECARMVKVCSSYAEKKDDFRPSLHALPLKTVLEESKKLNQYAEDKLATSQTAEACRKAVTAMVTVQDLCSVVVNLVTNAKTARHDNAASMRCSAILNALEEFEWPECKISKLH